MHTGERAVKLLLKKIFGCVMDSKMLFGHLSKHLRGCLIAAGILFCLPVVISGAVDQGDEVTWDYRLGANEITGSVAVQRDSGRELCTVCPFSPPGAPPKCQVSPRDSLCETVGSDDSRLNSPPSLGVRIFTSVCRTGWRMFFLEELQWQDQWKMTFKYFYPYIYPYNKIIYNIIWIYISI